MASILRSSKFVRYIAGFARNVVVNTPREFDGNFVNTATAQCYCGAIPRAFATQSSTQYDQNLERRLKTLDQDVRKSGRISRRDIEDVLEEIRNARSATSSQSLLVIRCCGSLVPEELPEVRTQLVEEIWNTLDRLNVPMDVSHYNALLRVYLENEHPFSPTEFLSNMESKGIEPNRVTYQRLISRYCQDGDIEGATKILEYMREKQMPVNENVFNALIFGHSQAEDMDSAHGILNVMQQAGLEPSADSYTTLLCGYGKLGDVKKINELIQECEQKEVYLLDKDYLDIIYSLATNGHDQYVPEILSKMRKSIGYNQDAINLILRLINKNCDSAAFELMKTIIRSSLPDGSLMPVGNFFIRQLVKADRSAEVILEYCSKLEVEKMYDKGVLLATEVSLELGKERLSYALLEQLHKSGFEMRQHYFWPLIVAKARDPSGKGILEVLRNMQNYDLTPSNETIREYVLPNLKVKSSEMLAILRDANIPLGTSVTSLVVNLLQKSDIAEAAVIANSVKSYFSPDLLKRPLTNALYASKDVNSYITLLRVIHDNIGRKTLIIENSEIPNKAEVIGSLIADLTVNTKQFINLIPAVLGKLVGEGLSISTNCAKKIEKHLGEKMTDHVSELLGKLTSGDLTPVPRTSSKPTYTPFNQMSIPQLERLIDNLTRKNQDTFGLKRHLFTLYYKEKKLEEMLKLFREFEADPNFELATGVRAQLLDTYVGHDKLDEALSELATIKKETGENFNLDDIKIIRLAALLIRNNKLDDAVKLLEETPSDSKNRNYQYSSTVWRCLNYLAEKGNTEDLSRVFETLVNNNYIDPDNVLLGPLIKVHIIRNDLDAAINKFEWCVDKFNATPWKNELTCKIIETEDPERLQKLTDLSTRVHGEINSLYDLVFAFVECGKIRQARKILEIPGLQTRPKKIHNACERFQQEGLVESLEGLKAVTKDLNHIDRSDIYYQLLLSYINQDDSEKCIGLWTQMQEEDLAPTNKFLIKLGSFLQEKGLEVPFAIPQATIKARPQQAPSQQTQSDHQIPLIFRQKLRDSDIDGCLEISRRYMASLPTGDVSRIIEKLIHSERLNEATKTTLGLLSTGRCPVEKIFRYVLNRLAGAGDVASLQEIGAKLNAKTKKIVSFDNRLCHANIVAGRAAEYLDQLEKDIDTASPDNIEEVAGKFPRGGAYGILEHYPELIDKYEAVAIKYANKGIIGPLNVLWTKYFINDNVQKTQEIWAKYLNKSPRIMFQKIVQTAREAQDEQLIKRLIEHLKISNVTEGATGNAFSCYLDVLIAKNKYEDAVQFFEKALDEVSIQSINRTAVLRVKEVYEKLNKEFNYAIPRKNKSQVEEDE